jgi:hypothetical protein
VGDAVSAPFFPKVAGDYCVDPHGETRTYGEKGKLSMDEVCTTAFDGECEVYKRFGLIRTVALRYVDGAGGDGSVEIYLSQFKADDGAYGMYTKRVVADADPAEPSAPRALAAGGSGALGTGRAYVWKGPYLLELQYNNEQESPEKLAQSSEKILSNLGKEIGRRLAGTADLPKAAAALRGDHRLPNGISFVLAEPLGVPKLGPAALGFYKDGEKRYRGLSLVRDDVAVAKGQFQVLRSRPGALPVAGVGEEAVHVILQESPDRPKAEYVVARQGTQLLGVGDEDFATSGQGLDAGARLSKDEKIAKGKEWLASSKGTAPAATPSATAAPSAPSAPSAKAKKP